MIKIFLKIEFSKMILKKWNVQHYENVKSEVEEWLTDNGFNYNIELDINAPCIIVNIKKTSNGVSSEDLDLSSNFSNLSTYFFNMSP